MKYVFRIWLATIIGGWLIWALIIRCENNSLVPDTGFITGDDIYSLHPVLVVIRNIPFLLYFPFYLSLIGDIKQPKWVRLLWLIIIGCAMSWFFDWLFNAKFFGMEYTLFSVSSIRWYAPFGICLIIAILWWGNKYYSENK